MKVGPRAASSVLFLFLFVFYFFTNFVFFRVFADFCGGPNAFFSPAAEVLQLSRWPAWDEQRVCPALDFLRLCVHVRVRPGWDFEVVCTTVAPQMEKFWPCLPYTHTDTHIHSGSRDDLPVPLQLLCFQF